MTETRNKITRPRSCDSVCGSHRHGVHHHNSELGIKWSTSLNKTPLVISLIDLIDSKSPTIRSRIYPSVLSAGDSDHLAGRGVADSEVGFMFTITT
jgi:hypothetical protein